ncbi:hypothetical protein NHQ30_003586 [Ciborinia camelliae]|nr:hypothetical protein NHQ30_003586 [Ciborinia camelliae]
MSSKNKPKKRVFSSLEEDEISKLSIESTDEEQYPSDYEYTVERILAQKSLDGQQLYLIRWDGFPEEACSWEPRKNILHKAIIDAWKARRIRESQGLDVPYDVGKLETLKKTAEDSKARRHRLRREKRKRQGIAMSPDESDADDGETKSTATLGDERSSERQQQVHATRKSKRRENIDYDSSSDEPLFVNSQRKVSVGVPSSTKVSRAQKESREHGISQAIANGTREPSPTESSSAVRGLPKTREGGATRGGSSLPQQNVFSGGKAARKQKPRLIEAAADKSKEQRHFKNRHILRKLELASRGLADAAPDPTAIPGGLIKPSKAVSEQRPETLRRTSSALQKEEGSIERTAPAKPPHEQVQDSQQLPDHPTHLADMSWDDIQHIPYEKRHICFFYTRPQGCLKINNGCKYLHCHDPQIPIAKPPEWFVESQKKICFFYNLNGNCRHGDACKDLHVSDPDLPVNKPPPGWVVSERSAKPMPREAQMPENVDGPNKICYYWYYEECMKGSECKLLHENNNTFPVAKRPGSVPCKYWNGGSCIKGKYCPFLHESAQDSHPLASINKVHTNEADIGTPNEENPHLPLHKSNSSLIFGDDDTMDFEMETIPDSLPLEPNLTKSEQFNLDNYSTNNAVQSTVTKVKAVTLGPQVQPINLDFTNLPPNASDWTQAFAGAETIKFDQICTPHDFKLRYSQIQQSTYWQENVSTAFTDQAGCDLVSSVAENLHLRMSGLACISDTYIVVLYPVAAEEWKYLDVVPKSPTDAKLKYSVFGSQSPIPSSIRSSTINQTSSKDLSFRDMMMRSFHHLDYEELIAEQKIRKPVNFCLIFPASANPIAESIASWLRSCSKDSKIYNYQKPGCWGYFKKRVKAGAVLIHSSALSLISDTDLIRDMTVGVDYSFWCIEDSTSKVPFSFNRYIPKPQLGQIVTRQILPLGYAILLTPSFLVAEPVMALNFLRWYQKKLKSSISGSVKVLCCHELPKFLGELFISKVTEQQELMKSLTGDQLMLSKLSTKGLSQEQCAARIDLYSLLIYDILGKDLPSHLSPFDRDPSEEKSRSPLLFAPPSIEPNDEKELICWFAGWAYANLDKYRRFYVVGSEETKHKWYQDWKKHTPEGKSTEHIILDKWEGIFKSLNIHH